MATPFIYLQSDRTKTPVVLADQPQGTQLVQVTAGGREIPFTVGKKVTNTMETIQARFASSRRHPDRES